MTKQVRELVLVLPFLCCSVVAVGNISSVFLSLSLLRFHTLKLQLTSATYKYRHSHSTAALRGTQLGKLKSLIMAPYRNT